jgi:outer membrane protein OmpA-like peptidoglycan-associated protein/tetratricopeptide (TPR) repeat protein
MLRNILFLVLFLCSSGFLSAQKELFDKADAFFAANLYKDAILAYEKALSESADQPLAIARLAESYYLTNNHLKAEQWYQKLLDFPNAQRYYFNYAQTLKSNDKFEAARKYFLESAKQNAQRGIYYASSIDFIEKQQLSTPLFEVKSLPELNSKNADYAPVIVDNALLFASSRPVAIEKFGQMTWTNDAFNQYYISKDQKTSIPFRNFVGRDINDAPMSYSAKEEWVAITSNNFMDGIRHIEGSGMLMDIYLYKTKSQNEWDTDSEQFFPHNANVNSDKPYSSGHPFLSADATTLFFCSNKAGGFGGYDIYVSIKTKSGWSEPKNLGPQINTPGNEMCPFFDGFGNLYFSSDWHHGFGGMDVFVCRQFSDSWSEALNLGKGVNSPYDDMYFVFSATQNLGFFSSNRTGGQGNEDIYEVKMLRPLQTVSRKLLKSGDKVVVNDAFSLSASFVSNSHEFAAFLESLKSDPNAVVQIYVHTDSKGSTSGNLNLSAKQAKSAYDYLIQSGITPNRIRYEGKGEQFTLNACADAVPCGEDEHKQNRRAEFYIIGKLDERGQFIREFEPTFVAVPVPVVVQNNDNPNATDPNKATKVLPDVKSPPPVIIEPEPKPVVKKPVKKSHYAVGDVIEVASIFYITNAASVDEKSPGLSQLIDVLNTHKHVILEIGAHTDAVGTSEYNLDLSQRRAEALKAYLVKKGITQDRLKAKGYGETQIKNRCKEGVKCSNEEHAENRRTEFKVIGHTGFKVGDVIKVDEIGYQMNKDVLDMKKSKGLQEIIHILKNGSISVEIRSHTDAKGTSDYNLQLSERRAKAVYDYLIQNGISKHRLKYKGYGETMVINRCKEGVNCSDAEHAQNRRTDFKVIGLK